MRRTKNVAMLGPGEAPPDDGREWEEVPKGNDRMWSVELHTRGRVTRGTATLWRLRAVLEGIKRRHPRAVKSSPGIMDRMIIRRERAGKVVAVFKNLPGPVASVAAKH